MNKIITQLNGGLGNQFFQYAVAKAIAINNNLELSFDINELISYTFRGYDLNNFNIEENFACDDEITQLKRKRVFKRTYFKEKRGKFMPEVLKIKNSAYLQGFWQSEKYFKTVSDVIRKDFTFKNLDFIKNQPILDEIKQTNAVSISVRCKDYIENPETAKVHNVCSMQYYKDAIQYMKKNVENPIFYIFSDDIEWVKENFKFDEPVVLPNTSNWQEDLYFMQNCKHNIVANSSFSWWAAWLNQNPDKIVVAPKKWYTDIAKVDYKSVVPGNWVKIRV